MRIIDECTIQVDKEYWHYHGGHLYNFLNDRIGYDNYQIENREKCDKKIMFTNASDVTAFFLWFTKED